MKFVGTGKRLQSGDIGHAAKDNGIETAVLLAFIEVEAAGRGFDNLNRPKMLFEPHIFYRQLQPVLRKIAVRDGLAYKNWKPGNYPVESYSRLVLAKNMSENAAFRSASYGLGQIMGFNCLDAGFTTAKQMFENAKLGEREQLAQLLTLLKNWNMLPLLRGKDFTNPENWRPVAKRYNGSAYARHGYHEKMANAYMKHKGKQYYFPITSAQRGLLASGAKGEQVRNLQADLATLGYEFPSGIDGRYGLETASNVMLYQKRRGLLVDGKAGDKTHASIAADLLKLKNDLSPPLPEWEEQTTKHWFIEFIKGLFK